MQSTQTHRAAPEPDRPASPTWILVWPERLLPAWLVYVGVFTHAALAGFIVWAALAVLDRLDTIARVCAQ